MPRSCIGKDDSSDGSCISSTFIISAKLLSVDSPVLLIDDVVEYVKDPASVGSTSALLVR